jgi:hypothetical protein
VANFRDRLSRPQQGAKVSTEAEVKSQIAEQLNRLEDELRRLKIEFDIFLNGGAKRPPYEVKNRVETLIKRLSDERALKYAQRYLFNSLVSRYTAFQNLWRRAMQSREEGREPHRQARHKTAAAAATPEIVMAAPAPAASFFTCSNAQQETPTVQAMYESLVAAKQQCGEQAAGLSFEVFQRAVVNKTQSMRERFNCERVRFAVCVNDGKVEFKAQAETG